MLLGRVLGRKLNTNLFLTSKRIFDLRILFLTYIQYTCFWIYKCPKYMFLTYKCDFNI